MGKRNRERIARILAGEEPVFRQTVDVSEAQISAGIGKLGLPQRGRAVDKMFQTIRKSYNPKQGARFANTGEEVDNFMKDVGPSLAVLFAPYRGEITEVCRNWRQKYGLPI